MIVCTAIRTIMASKKHLTLNIDSEVAEKAVADPEIKVSEITEKFLHACTLTSKNEDDEIRYKAYQELFNLMSPLLRKFRVKTEVGLVIILGTPSDDPDWSPEFDDYDNVLNDEPEETHRHSIFLLSNGKLESDAEDEIKIRDEPIDVYHRPQDIVDTFLNSIQEGANYRKKQFSEIEMAKTIIDAITNVKGKTNWK